MILRFVGVDIVCQITPSICLIQVMFVKNVPVGILEKPLMAKMNKFFPCKCGHLLKDHDYKHLTETVGCWNCSISGHWFNCEKGFTPDNLKFLEIAVSDFNNIKEI